ncbi:MAG: tyrosine-type recombinase/integrase [Enhydrobacter sp.]
MKLRLPFLLHDRDRHGNPRVYLRQPGQPMVRLHAPPGSDAFLEEYRRARQGDIAPKVQRRTPAHSGSLRGLVEAYYGSANFRMLASSTQRARRGILDDICLSRTKGDHERGTLPFARLEARHVRELRDAKLELPEAANGRIKALRQVFDWAIEGNLIALNPARPVKLLKGDGEGFHTWAVDEVAAYEAAHPVGSKARLALALLLYTGVRRSDVVKLGPQMERDNVLHFAETKGANSRALKRKGSGQVKSRALPILPALREAIDAAPSGHLTYLATEWGRPFTANGFGNRFRKWCDDAGLKHCSAHGLRKAGATIAAENGATPHQLGAIFGWTTLRQAEGYTRRANQQRMAIDAMPLLMPRRREQNER